MEKRKLIGGLIAMLLVAIAAWALGSSAVPTRRWRC